ncbi:thiamine phosphate synthase [Cryobacterium levicorallinum]|uniref:Thiamine-phosphate synthase n=1 Tax=Cryobacterium levicorallinum TaxID=995038 RepID=A0A1I3A5M4_9MICO|nr:thiamine phosphate synthase [Cryobacterium levicorallinum]TFB82638.1 thiamine phosphate synthase [Cryobacterium levicorallinum]GEP26310.1 thiamine-phosphate synthase [Cryobacterium levicorallinum]SFH45374.1 thiamine-phosphate pyrophosphorylase [Cryobacterium levicorallinum]
MDQTKARLYLCTDARKDRGDFADFVAAAFAGGVDIIQLRDKNIDAAEELEYLEILRSVADQHARLWAVNDRADIGSLTGAPVFHVGQTDLPVASARTLLGPAAVIGLSTHTTEHVDAALAANDLNYFCVGPVWATPTKPGRAAVGTLLLRYAAARSAATDSELPWFAIGGIDLSNINQVVDAGATRVVVVRAITDANDPTDAAQRLLASLPALG